MKKRLLIVCCALCSLMACNSKTDTGTTLSGLKKADFDTTVSGKKDRFIRTEKQKWCRGSDHELRRSYRFYLGTRPERQVR